MVGSERAEGEGEEGAIPRGVVVIFYFLFLFFFSQVVIKINTIRYALTIKAT